MTRTHARCVLTLVYIRCFTLLCLTPPCQMESRATNEHGEVVVRESALNLVDLAGSESVRNTAATGQRAKEGGNINKSLLTLSRVIQMLAEGTAAAGAIPFRDSKLTRLLQPMLLGNAAMCMICCVTPAEQFASETKSTLQFAQRAKLVRMNPEVNEALMDDASKLKALRRQVAELTRLKDAAASKDVDGDATKAERDAVAAANAAENERLAAELATAQAQVLKFQKMMASELRGGGGGGEEGEGGFFGEDTLGSSRAKGSKAAKRHRETWCPGERGTPLPEALADLLSPSKGPNHRRRLSAGGGGTRSLTEESGDSALSASSANDFQVPALEAMLEKRCEELADRDAEIAALGEDLAGAQADAEAAAAEAAEETAALKKRLAEMAAAAEEAAGQMAELEKDQLDLVGETKALKQALAAAEHDKEALAAGKALAEDTVEAAAARIETLEAEALAFEERLEAAVKEAADEASDAEYVTELEARVGGLEADMEAAAEVHAEALAAATAATEAAVEAAAAAQAALAAKETAAQETAAAGGDGGAAERVLSLEAELATVAAQLAAFQEAMVVAAGEADAALAAKASELDAFAARSAADLEAQGGALLEAQAALAARDEQLAEALAAKEQAELAVAKAAEQAEADAAAAAAALAAAKPGALVAELEEARAEVAELQVQLSNDVRLREAAKQGEAAQSRACGEAGKLRVELTARDEELRAVRAQAESLATELRLAKEAKKGDLAAASECAAAGFEKRAAQQAMHVKLLENDLAAAKLKVAALETQLSKAGGAHEKQLEKLSAELNAVRAKAAAAEDAAFRTKALEAAVAAANAKALANGAAAEEAEARARAAATAADGAAAEAEGLKAQLGSLGGGGLQSEVDRKAREAEEASAEAGRLAAELKGAESRLKKVKAENDLLRAECARVGDLSEQLAEAQASLEDASGSAEYVAELEAAVKEKEAALASSNEANLEMAQQCQALEEAQMEAEAKLSAAERAAARATADREGALAAAASADAASAAASTELATVRAELREYVAATGSAKAKLASREERLASLEAKLAAAEKQAASATDAAEAEAAKAREARAEAAQAVAAATSAATAAAGSGGSKAEETRLRTELSTVKTEYRERLEQAALELKEKEARIAELDKVKFTKELQDKFGQIIKERDEGKKAVKRLTAELDGLRAKALSDGGSAAEEKVLAKALAEEKERSATLERKLRKYVDYAAGVEQGKGAAEQCVEILRVALSKPKDLPVGLEDLPELALDLCKRLSEAEDAANAACDAKADVGALKHDLDETRESVMLLESRLERATEAAADAKAEAGRAAQAASAKVAEAEARAAAASAAGEAGSSSLAAKLSEKVREVKFLESENLALMLECKDVKKQASAARAELEQLQRSSKASPAGSLSLPPTAPSLAAAAAHPAVLKENAGNHLTPGCDPFAVPKRTTRATAAGGAKPAPVPAALQPKAPVDENPAECKQS